MQFKLLLDPRDVMSSLNSKIDGFFQKGTGVVSAIESGTILKHLTGLGKKMNGIEANAYAEQYGASNVYQWIGNIKAQLCGISEENCLKH